MLFFLCLFFSISLHTSEQISNTKKSSVFFNSSYETDFFNKRFDNTHKPSKDDQDEEPSTKKQKPSPDLFTIPSSTQTPKKSLEEMRALMKTITHTLSSKALTVRKNPVDIQSLGVENKKIQNLIQAATKFRRITSCQQQNDLNNPNLKTTYEKIVTALTQKLKSCEPEIEQERHAQAIKSFITDEITESRTDFYRRLNRTIFPTSPLPMPTDHVKHLENFDPQPTAASRKLFNDLFIMEQAIICDDTFARSQGVISFRKLKEDYKTLKPFLSRQAQKYAIASLNSIQQTLEEPNPGQSYFKNWSRKNILQNNQNKV